MSLPLIKYVLLAAIRDKLIISMVISLILSASLSLFFGSSAIIEQDIFTLVFASSALRIVGVFGLVTFVIFFVRRSFEHKDIEFLLSRPIGRVKLIFSYGFAFSLMACVVSMCVIAVVVSIAPHLFSQDFVIWGFSIFIENVIMVNVALFFAMYISSAASASMVTMGFYILGRMMGQLLGIVDSALVDSNGVLAMALQFVSVVTPRFDLLAQSSWLIYGVNEQLSLVFVVSHGLIFSTLVLLAASLDLTRRQF